MSGNVLGSREITTSKTDEALALIELIYSQEELFYSQIQDSMYII